MESNKPDSLPLVSVIIPSYNCEPYIRQTITSVLDQSMKDLELIVVDDGSSDNTCQLVQQFGERVRLIRQQNARVCAARNRGIREARGQYLCFMDHDDAWFPHKLEVQLKTLQQYPQAAAVCSNFICWYPDAQGVYPAIDSFKLSEDLLATDPEQSGWIYHRLLLDCCMLTSSTMIRAKVFEHCSAFDESLPYSEDWDLWIRLSRDYPLIKLAAPTTLYRQHPAQGNRIVREVDYRTRLLENAVQQWGLVSQDGRAIRRTEFNRRLAFYHAEYGGQCLMADQKSRALASFGKAWRYRPLNLKYPAYILAALFNWKPGW